MLDLSPGTVLEERYKILRRLGQGGMGAVYLAEDKRLNRRCAVKMALHAGPDAEAQFRREAALLAGLHHPNLPRVTDYFTQAERYFLVMDYVEGQDFQHLVRRKGRLSESRVLRWLPQILDALEYLHNQPPQPIIHRDIKPANIKLTPEGRVMLVDFGIAKRQDPQMSTVLGARAVSPGFSPPEQYGRGRTDARSDIFSLGATLYYLLTGVPPVEAIDRIAGAADLVPPRHHNPEISPATERAILTAMALSRNDRFASVRELRQALPARKRTPPASPRGQGFRLDRLAPYLGLLLVVLVIGVAGVWGIQAIGNRSEPTTTPVVVAVTVQRATDTTTATTVAPSPGPKLTELPASPTPVPTRTQIPAVSIEPTSTLRPAPAWTVTPTSLLDIPTITPPRTATATRTLPPIREPTTVPSEIEVTRTVEANVEWNDTEVLVGTGDAVNIRYISGRWRVGNCDVGDWPLLDADGDPSAPHDLQYWPLPGANLGALIAKVDEGPPMLIGRGRSFTANIAGRLYLGVNDDPVYDNCGSMAVQIIVKR